MMIEGMGGAVNDWAQGRHQQRMRVLGDAIFGRTQQPVQRTYDADATDRLLSELRAERDESRKNAIVNLANDEGSHAQVLALRDALKAVAPNHPLLQLSNQKYKDGKAKSKLRLIWEAAFDNKLRSAGGVFAANPKAHRKD
jgi:hypothetical protein